MQNVNEVLVVSHRSTCGNAPENSLLGVKNCIEIGVDMVEIDLALTKDSVLVLLHDKTLDRTTSDQGRVANWTYDSLSKLRLRDSIGNLSHQTIPTFKDLMLTCNGKVDVFVDKGYDLIPLAYKVLLETKTIDQAHFLGFKSGSDFKKDYPIYSRKVNYMPLVLPINNVNEMLSSFSDVRPKYYLYSFDHEDEKFLETVPSISEKAYALATTQVSKYCAGHTDSVSIVNPKDGWGWIIDQGFNSICTDHPAKLLNYLKSRNLHQ